MSTARPLLKPIAVGIAAAFAVAAVGSTITDLGLWYRSLAQPAWAPPDWAFPVGWTTVYVFTVAAGVTAWRTAFGESERTRITGLFAFNAFLNVLWSLIFFRLHRPDWAFVEVIVFWLSIMSLIVVAARRSLTAKFLLLPYLGWVSFASLLNLAVVRLNPPFA
ncbi:MAG: TspO/MBR family protein [Janthinobacterium lividum]